MHPRGGFQCQARVSCVYVPETVQLYRGQVQSRVG